jgi:ABC-type multidrug transport system ATPase subunit
MISLIDAGKRYNREWIFRHCTHQFNVGNAYAITGPNGSGKSTLLQVIAGAIRPNEGEIKLQSNQKTINEEQHHTFIAIAAPYLELIEEMTPLEFLAFHQQFKPFIQDFSTKDILRIVQLEQAAEKQIRYFSSGMKQRLKLAQCIFSDVPFVLLDEPCTNLDTRGIELYHQLIENYTTNRCVIISSNDLNEYGFCKEVVEIGKFKF